MTGARRTSSERGLGSAARVAMLVHADYPGDERVKREACALVGAGFEVDVLCLRRDSLEPARDEVDGVRVYRMPVRRHRGAGKAGYLLEYGAFFWCALVGLAILQARRRYRVVQVHTPPDALVFAALPGRLGGARILLDIHDLMPELYRSKYGLAEDSRTVRLLLAAERAAVGFADAVVTASGAFAQRLASRGRSGQVVGVVVNSADPAIFGEVPAMRAACPRGPADAGFNVVWHGSMVERYGLDLAIRAVALLKDRIPGLELRLYGEGERLADLRRLASDLGVADMVRFEGFVVHERMAGLLAQADLGIVTNRPDVHIDMAFPTKLFEFVAAGVPVVATRTPILESVFGDSSVRYCSADAASVAEGIEWAYLHLQARSEMARAALGSYEPLRWDSVGPTYVDLVSRLARGEPAAAGQQATAEERRCAE